MASENFFIKEDTTYFFYNKSLLKPQHPVCQAKVRRNAKDLTYLLTPRERRVILTLNKEYRDRFCASPQRNLDLVYYLGDNADRRCWSATSNKIPTLRMAGGLTWSVSKKRFLTGREKLGTLGFPVAPACAHAMGVCELPVLDPKRCSKISGNCMHWSCIGVVQMIALICFKEI